MGRSSSALASVGTGHGAPSVSPAGGGSASGWRRVGRRVVGRRVEGCPPAGVGQLGTEQPPAQVGEPGHVPRGQEPVDGRPIGVGRPQQLAPLQLAPQRERGLVGRADQDHLRAHHVGDDAGQVRVVGAAEQQRVDVGRPHRREEALGQDRHLLAVGLAPLDELDEARARRGGERDVRPGRLDGPGVGAGRHGAHRADHADAARPGGLDEGSRAGLDHLEDGDRQLGRQLVEAGRGRGVAGHDHGLGLEVLDQAPGQLAGEDLDLGLGPGPVRVAAGVADVDEVLGRQQVEHGPGDGQPPEAGVEHPDGPIHRRQATERPASGPATLAAARKPRPGWRPRPDAGAGGP